MSVNPLTGSGLPANLAAMIKVELASLAADALTLRNLLSTGDVVSAVVLPSNGMMDLIDIGGLRVAAELPPVLLPGQTITVKVTGFTGDRINLQILPEASAAAPASPSSSAPASLSPSPSSSTSTSAASASAGRFVQGPATLAVSMPGVTRVAPEHLDAIEARIATSRATAPPPATLARSSAATTAAASAVANMLAHAAMSDSPDGGIAPARALIEPQAGRPFIEQQAGRPFIEQRSPNLPPESPPADALPHAPPDAVPDAPPHAVPGVPPRAMPDVLPHAVPDVPPRALPDALQHALPDTLLRALPDALPHALPNALQQSLPNALQQSVPNALQQALPNALQQAVPNVLQQAAPNPMRQAVPNVLQQAAPNPMQQAVPNAPRQAVPNAPRQAVPIALQQGLPNAMRQAVPNASQQAVPSAPATFAQPEALLRALHLPVTVSTVAAARLALDMPGKLPHALTVLDRVLANNVDPHVATLRTLVGFLARLEPDSPVLATQVAAFVDHVVIGREGKLAQLLQAYAQAANVPAEEASGQPATLAAERVAVGQAAVDYDFKTQLLAVVTDRPDAAAGATGAKSSGLAAAASSALTAVTALQLGTASALAVNPDGLTFALPIALPAGFAQARVRIDRGMPQAASAGLDGDNFHIAFVLDTQNLGTVAIDLVTVGRAVTLAVKTEAAPAQRAFGSALSQLTQRLEALHYRVAQADAVVAPRGAAALKPDAAPAAPSDGGTRLVDLDA